MFVHGKTNKTYYSVREKLKYYKSRLKDSSLTKTQRDYAEKRIVELDKLNRCTYDEPQLVVTDDARFGNGISKPRMCVAVKRDSKDRVMLTPLNKRTSESIILDEINDRQISRGRVKWVNKDDIYERKYIDDSVNLTKYDIAKIKKIFVK